MNFDIFRAYDVRGIYPSEIDEDIFYAIGKGYAYVFKPKEIVIGRDVRLSSNSLQKSLVQGFLDSGVNVIDIGIITTDMLYFSVGYYNYSGGIIVTASHNPKEYNGLKFVKEKATAISSDTGLYEIRDALKLGLDKKISPKQGGIYSEKHILDDYLNHVLKFIDINSVNRLKIVANSNYGFVSTPIQQLAERLKLDLKPLNFTKDGSFPKGPPDPLLPENRKETEKLVKKSKVDFGVAWDADADRVMFFDENGTFISGAYITALLAEIMLKKYGTDNKIILDTRVTWPILKVVNKMHGHPIVSKVGHAFMKDRMRSENALFAGEMSAHYYFRDNFYADNGIIPFLLIIEYLSKEKKKLSAILAPYIEGHYMTGELNYRTNRIKEIIERVMDQFGSLGKEDFTDGYAVESKTWRFNIRPSNTEPLLRLNVEAISKEILDEIRGGIEEIIDLFKNN